KMYNPIEIICFYVAQPIVDFLGYLLNEVHFLAFLLATALLGVILGIGMGLVSVAWYKWQGVQSSTKKPTDDAPAEPKGIG
ncbi:hypothetical protein KR222_010062, partial [Zaprionus bogoriensis]